MKFKMRYRINEILCMLCVVGLVYLATIYWLQLSHDDTDTKHKLAIVVPFRGRFDELLIFVPYIWSYLQRRGIKFEICIINQIDNYRFNRASLVNVGFKLTNILSDFDYMIIHDIDLLPLNSQLDYGYPEAGPLHISSWELHPRYHYPEYLGGILALTKEQFVQVNGMSNSFWGWGREDDEFRMRLIAANFKIQYPLGIKTGHNNTFMHIHDDKKRTRDYARLFNQAEMQYKRDFSTGLSTLSYRLHSKHSLTIDGATCTVYSVYLECDINRTPWCQNKRKTRKRKLDVITNPKREF